MFKLMRNVFILICMASLHFFLYYFLGNRIIVYGMQYFDPSARSIALLVGYSVVAFGIGLLIAAVLLYFRIAQTKTVLLGVCSMTLFSLLPSIFWGHSETNYLILMRVAQMIVIFGSLLCAATVLSLVARGHKSRASADASR